MNIYTPANALWFETSLLKWWGIYPIYGEKNESHILFCLRFLRGITTAVISLTFCVSIWLNIFFNMDDSSVIIESLYFGLTQTTYICKLLNIHGNHNDYKEIVDFLSSDTFNQHTEEQYHYIYGAVQKSQIFSICFRSAVTVTILFFCAFPFLDNSLLPLPSYFPWSVADHRYIFFIYQMVGIVINGYCHSSLDVIVVTLITIGSAQFEVLKDNLVNFRKDLDDDIANRRENDIECERRLNACVQHHVNILSYVYKIEALFSFVQFVQFIASSIIICVTGFQIIVTPFTDLKFITLTLYFFCNLIQVTMCCWFGHDIKTKSEGVGESCYMSDWHNCGPSVCKILFIIMERAKIPVTLTAGKFFELTLQTLMQVLKTSYSYLALLRRMNEIRESK